MAHVNEIGLNSFHIILTHLNLLYKSSRPNCFRVVTLCTYTVFGSRYPTTVKYNIMPVPADHREIQVRILQNL